MKKLNQSFALVLLFALLLVAAGCESATAPVSGGAIDQPVGGTVTLSVKFNSDRKNLSVRVPCSKDSTVFDILQRAQNLGDLKFTASGSGATTFVSSIGGVENLKGEGDNWIYKVNDSLGDKSCGEYLVKPGDEVQWSFGKYP